ncbi:MAG: hypothetical protein EBZ75_15160, partial [Oxalobacteraceae bacterium]|nr:hypothetical protein [Oxalobacteraceae bacterium]
MRVLFSVILISALLSGCQTVPSSR